MATTEGNPEVRNPLEQRRIREPAADMSLTSNAYYVHAGDRWMLSTCVVLPKTLEVIPEPELPFSVQVGAGDASDYEQSDQEELAQLLGQR